MLSTIVFITTTILVWYFTWYFSTYSDRYPSCSGCTQCSSPPGQSNPETFVDYKTPGIQPSEERTRYSTSYSPGSTTIYRFPKKGGVYILQNALAPEFEFLGLDRFVSLHSGLDYMGSLKQDYPIPSSDEEEIFCNKFKDDSNTTMVLFWLHI